MRWRPRTVMRAECRLVADGNLGRHPAAVAQFARLRAMQLRTMPPEGAGLSTVNARALLVALSFDTVAAFDAGQQHRLRDLVRAGATLYVRGGLNGSTGRIPLAPFAEERFTFVPPQPAD